MRVNAGLVALALLTCAVLVPVAALAQATDQPGPTMFLYDAAHRGLAPAPLTVPLHLNWKYTADAAGSQHLVASPAVDADSVYFFTGKSMHVLSRANGSAKWDKPLDLPDTVDSTPLIADGSAVFGCRDGKVYFVDVSGKIGKITGTFDLRRQHPGYQASPSTSSAQPRVQSSPLYHDGKIFFGGDDGWVYALDLASQEKMWEFPTGGPIKATPAYWNHGIYVASEDGSLYGLNERTGRPRWQCKLWLSETDPKDVLASPVVTNSLVLASRGAFLYACDFGRNGYVRWRFEAKGNIIGSPAVSGGLVLFGDSEGKFYALKLSAEGNFSYSDASSDYIQWQIPLEPGAPAPAAPEGPTVVVSGLDQPVKSSPTVAGTAVIYLAGQRQINALNIADGKLAWTCDLSEAAAIATPTRATTGPSMGLGGPGGAGAFGLGAPGAGGPGLGALGAPGALGGLGTPGAGGAAAAPQGPAGPSLVFEDEVAASPVAAGDDLFIVGDDGALYDYSQKAADGVPPGFDQAGIEVPGQGDTRVAQTLKLAKTTAEATDQTGKLKLNGAVPVYVRIRTNDEGSGINPQSITVTQDAGGEGVKWEPAYDAAGGYIWAMCEPGKGGVSKNLPDGDYVLTFAVSDWSGNEGKASVAFSIDNSLPPPGPAPGTMRPGMGGPGMGFPGMGGPGMGEPGMMGPGGPGMPLPGMPGGVGAPAMPAMPAF